MLLGTSQFPLSGSAEECGADVSLQPHGSGSPSSNAYQDHCVILSFLTTSTRLCHHGEREKEIFLERNCFCPSYMSGHSVRAVAWLFLCCHSRWRHCGCWTVSAATIPTHSTSPTLSTSPTHSNTPTFRYSDTWTFQVCLCIEKGILYWIIIVWLVSLSGETMKSLTQPWSWHHPGRSYFLT